MEDTRRWRERERESVCMCACMRVCVFTSSSISLAVKIQKWTVYISLLFSSSDVKKWTWFLPFYFWCSHDNSFDFALLLLKGQLCMGESPSSLRDSQDSSPNSGQGSFVWGSHSCGTVQLIPRLCGAGTENRGRQKEEPRWKGSQR